MRNSNNFIWGNDQHYRERISQLESVSNQTSLFQTVVATPSNAWLFDWLFMEHYISIEKLLAYCQDILKCQNFVINEGQSIA